MIIVLDVDRVEDDLARGVLACPRCGAQLRAWSWATPRRIRQLDGSTLVVRPRRARCRSCRATQVLLPADCLPRHGDAAEVIGAALLARAQGRGHRAIAADLNRAPTTVRRWLRRARGAHLTWLYRQGIDHAYRLDPDVIDHLAVHDSELANALTALAGAVHAW